MTQYTAHDGLALPPIGLGTYKLRGAEGVDAVGSAIAAGYRLLDSAVNYENEGAVGKAARQSGIPEADIIYTSKLPGRHHAYDAALTAIEESVYRSGLEAIGLYLIHWPNPNEDKFVDAWRALIAAREHGWVRHIGVSNFLPEYIDRLEAETGVLPAVNQIELHPYFPQTDVLDYHRERGIIVEAWSPVGRGADVTREAVIAHIAEAHGITPIQTILAWQVARGVVPLPKSADPRRQRENLEAADITLTPEEVEAITALGRDDGRLFDADPRTHEEF